MFLDSSDTKKQTASATSSGVCSFFKGIFSSTIVSKTCRADIPLYARLFSVYRLPTSSHIDVQSNPGQIALTVMLSGANSNAVDWVKLITAALDAE